jgi:HPt (histidine-containing phosphotransfer) domain-containing protein
MIGSDAGGDRLVVVVPEELEPLVPRFLEKRHAEVEVLREAAERGDLETLRSRGHALKGTAGGYGFQELTELGAALETRADEGDLSGASEVVGRIAAYLARVDVRYE